MPKAIPAEVDLEGFESNLRECSAHLQDMVAVLRVGAANGGFDVEGRRYRHLPPNLGWGVTYYVHGRPFCHLHPKRRDDSISVSVVSAHHATLVAEGLQPLDQAGWYKVRTMHQAVRWVKWILWAHDQVAAKQGAS